MGKVITKLLVVIVLVGYAMFLTERPPQTRTARAANQIEKTETHGFPDQTHFDAVIPHVNAMLLPLHTYVAPAETCTLQVWVGGTPDSLGCIGCWVSFDTSFVTLILAEEGDLFQSAPYPRIFFWEHIAPDTESVEGCLLGYKTYTLTPGEIARYVFEAKKNGVCPVRITKLDLFDIDRVMYQPIIDPNAWIIIGTSTGVEPASIDKGEFRAFPNPFNPSTTLILRVSSDAWSDADTHTTISIYSPAGRIVRSLFEGNISSGENRVTWDGRDERGVKVASGVYFAVARTHSTTYRTKLVLVQ